MQAKYVSQLGVTQPLAIEFPVDGFRARQQEAEKRRNRFEHHREVSLGGRGAGCWVEPVTFRGTRAFPLRSGGPSLLLPLGRLRLRVRRQEILCVAPAPPRVHLKFNSLIFQELHFFLCDMTVEIVEMPPRSNRPLPRTVFLSRRPLPRPLSHSQVT